MTVRELYDILFFMNKVKGNDSILYFQDEDGDFYTINFLDCESVKKCCVLGIGNGETLDVFGMVYEISKQENRRGGHSYYDDAILRVFNKNLELVYEPIAESFHLDDDGDFVIRMRCLNG